MPQVITPLNFHPTANGAHAIAQADWIDSRALGVTTAETVQAPAGAKYVRIAADGVVYAKIAAASTAAAIPTDITDGTASECLSGAGDWRILPGDPPYISLISAAARVVTLSFYRN
jgi:hypothetical protein